MAEAGVNSLAELAEPCTSAGSATALIEAPFQDAMNTGEYEPAPLTACCKICTVGIACGNTCISARYTCHVGAGCACNAGAGAPIVPVAPPAPPALPEYLRAPEASLAFQSPYPRIQVGQSAELRLRVTRLHGPTWFDGDVGLYVTNKDEASRGLRGWDEQGLIGWNRGLGLLSDEQEFRLLIQATAPGTHRLRVGFKHNTAGWFGPSGVYWDVVIDSTPGATRLTQGWHSSWVSQSPYLIMRPGQVAEFSIVFRNVGTETWRRGFWTEQVNLALNRDDKSPYRQGMAVNWLWDDRIATTSEATVSPGQTGLFVFKVRAPLTPGVYLLNLRPVADGRVWLEDEGVFWVIDVRN